MRQLLEGPAKGMDKVNELSKMQNILCLKYSSARMLRMQELQRLGLTRQRKRHGTKQKKVVIGVVKGDTP